MTFFHLNLRNTSVWYFLMKANICLLFLCMVFYFCQFCFSKPCFSVCNPFCNVLKIYRALVQVCTTVTSKTALDKQVRVLSLKSSNDVEHFNLNFEKRNSLAPSLPSRSDFFTSAVKN